jgi:hypothetical protein
LLELQADFNDEGNADNLNYQQLRELTELADYQEPQESEEDMPIVDVDSSEDEEVEEQQPVASAVQISIAPPPLPDQHPQSTPNDLSEPEPRERADPGKYPLPNRFKFAMGMFVKKIGMSRSDYKTLRGVLRMLEVPEASTSDINVYRAKMRELLSLPDTSDTLKRHVDRQMPMIELRRQEIALDSTQLPTLAAGDKGKDKEKKQYIHFINPIDMFKNLLSCDSIKQKLHTGLGHFVDEPTEVYHGLAWLSSVRTCSGETVSIDVAETEPAQQRMVFPSDIVMFRCGDNRCECEGDVFKRHLGRVIAIGKDHRTIRNHKKSVGAIVLKVQPIWSKDKLPSGSHRLPDAHKIHNRQ